MNLKTQKSKTNNMDKNIKDLWQPIKTGDTFAHLPIAQENGNPLIKIANEARRIHNRAQDRLKENSDDAISMGKKETALDMLAFVEQVEDEI